MQSTEFIMSYKWAKLVKKAFKIYFISKIKVDKTARLQPLSLKAEQVAAFELSRTFFIKL